MHVFSFKKKRAGALESAASTPGTSNFSPQRNFPTKEVAPKKKIPTRSQGGSSLTFSLNFVWLFFKYLFLCLAFKLQDPAVAAAADLNGSVGGLVSATKVEREADDTMVVPESAGDLYVCVCVYIYIYIIYIRHFLYIHIETYIVNTTACVCVRERERERECVCRYTSMYVCMFVCMYVCMCVCIICMYNMFVCVCVCVYVYISMCVCVYIYTCIYVYVCIYRIYIYMYICICVYI